MPNMVVYNTSAAADAMTTLVKAMADGWNGVADAADKVRKEFLTWQASLPPKTKANGARTWAAIVAKDWDTGLDKNDVRRAIVTTDPKNKALVAKYVKATKEPTLRGATEFVDNANKPKPPAAKPLTAAQKRVVAQKVTAVKALLAGLDKDVVKAILADAAK